MHKNSNTNKPLIDLTFLLLIIFMITAPLLEQGLDVSPPEMNAEQLPDKESKVINLNKNGNIVLDREIVSSVTLIDRLSALSRSNKDLRILVRADGDRPYREVMDLMKAVKSSGISNISLVTQVEQIKRD